MELVTPVFFAAVCLVLLIILRYELVFSIRIRAINEVFSQRDWQENVKLLVKPSYDAMAFDLTTWTFKGFYPVLYERQVAREIQEHDE